MANELQYLHYATGATLYVVLYNAVGQVWNVVAGAWATMATAMWANYAINLSESPASGYRYQASMPAVAAGVYSAHVFARAGAAAAVGDTCLAAARIEWDGSAEILPATAASAAAAILVTPANRLVTDADGKVQAGNALTAQQARDALKLAPSVGDPAAESVDDHLDKIAENADIKTSDAVAAIRGGERTLENLATPGDTQAGKLAADGLDDVSIAEPANAADAKTNLPKMIAAIFRWLLNRRTLTQTKHRVYKDDDATVLFEQAVSDDGSTQATGKSP